MAAAKFIRIWEIDWLRGITIIFMIIYHVFFDLNFFGILPVAIGKLWLVQKSIAVSFLVLVGISLVLSYQRSRGSFIKYLKRGLWIILAGMLITTVTFIFYRQGTVWFGVLHLIGLSVILAYPFIRRKYLCLSGAILIIIAGFYVKKILLSTPLLLWLGLMPYNFMTLDYFPLLPWFGVVLIGLFIGNMLFSNYKRRYRLPDFLGNSAVKAIAFLGRHSLLIYLIHQPVLIGMIYLSMHV